LHLQGKGFTLHMSALFFPNIRVGVLVWSVMVIWLDVLELEYWSGYLPLFLHQGAGSTQQLHPAFTQYARYRLVVGSLGAYPVEIRQKMEI
jgi:hypothetical protein